MKTEPLTKRHSGAAPGWYELTPLASAAVFYGKCPNSSADFQPAGCGNSPTRLEVDTVARHPTACRLQIDVLPAGRQVRQIENLYSYKLGRSMDCGGILRLLRTIRIEQSN